MSMSKKNILKVFRIALSQHARSSNLICENKMSNPFYGGRSIIYSAFAGIFLAGGLIIPELNKISDANNIQ